MEELHHALQEAELEASISILTMTIHCVELENEEMEATTLGPTLTTELTIEGVLMKAMTDTSTPVSCIPGVSVGDTSEVASC